MIVSFVGLLKWLCRWYSLPQGLSLRFLTIAAIVITFPVLNFQTMMQIEYEFSLFGIQSHFAIGSLTSRVQIRKYIVNNLMQIRVAHMF
ncbi:hypothetical protein AK965_01815 [Vibrio sp. PID17_43]|nr:hypothetical protein AK965_01815 [Vibrio sp. PID17_43]